MRLTVLRRTTRLIASGALALVAVHEASAQGTARSLDLDPSVRAAGMALASNAVFWGGTPNHWANPALLAYERGLRYEWGKTQLVPDFADDVFFETKRLTLGGGGLALALAGRPLDRLGGLLVDYGAIELTDPSGNSIGTYHAFEKIRSWSFGVSLAELAENAASLMHQAPPRLARYGDISFGWSRKDVAISLAPWSAGKASTTAHDVGLLVRVTPVNSIDGHADAAWPVRMDASYGWSILSYDDAKVIFLDEDRADPVSRHRRSGVAGRFALGLPRGMRRSLEEHRIGWMIPGFTPLASISVAYDHARVSAGDDDSPSSSYVTDGIGFEFTLANVISLRQGWYEDLDGEIDGTTFGWSVGLPLGALAGIRYDRARFPQARGLTDLQREAWTAWVDPLAVWAALRSGTARD